MRARSKRAASARTPWGSWLARLRSSSRGRSGREGAGAIHFSPQGAWAKTKDEALAAWEQIAPPRIQAVMRKAVPAWTSRLIVKLEKVLRERGTGRYCLPSQGRN